MTEGGRQALPLAFLIEKCGGASSDGMGPLLDVVVTKLDQRFYKDQSDHRRLWNKYRPDARVDAVETIDAPLSPKDLMSAEDLSGLQSELEELEELRKLLVHVQGVRQRQQSPHGSKRQSFTPHPTPRVSDNAEAPRLSEEEIAVFDPFASTR